MKLYTEKHLREAIAQGYDWCHQKYIPSDNMIEVFIRQLNPIELPSDEEVEQAIFPYMDSLAKAGFIEGAKWMREQIQGGNK